MRPQTLPRAVGSGTILANNGDGVQFSAATGTTDNDPRATQAASLRFQATTANPSFKLELTRGSGGSLRDFIVTYATRTTSGSGSAAVTWEWSTDGTNFSSANVSQPASVTYPGSGTVWYVRTADFTGVTAIDNIATGDSIWFRATLSDGTAEYFDNIVIQTVPAPVMSAPQFVGPGEFRFWVSGASNVTYTAQVSTDLASTNSGGQLLRSNWSPIPFFHHRSGGDEQPALLPH